MPQDLFDYDKMVETALRGVVREALQRTARDGLRGSHHFYIAFRTGMPGVVLPDYLREQFPDEMTIVLQHQFWGLETSAEAFSVGLSFQSKIERLTIPFAALTGFADPSVQFGLQFAVAAVEAAELPAPLPAVAGSVADKPAPERQSGEVVTLDKFRKR